MPGGLEAAKERIGHASHGAHATSSWSCRTTLRSSASRLRVALRPLAPPRHEFMGQEDKLVEGSKGQVSTSGPPQVGRHDFHARLARRAAPSGRPRTRALCRRAAPRRTRRRTIKNNWLHTPRRRSPIGRRWRSKRPGDSSEPCVTAGPEDAGEPSPAPVRSCSSRAGSRLWAGRLNEGHPRLGRGPAIGAEQRRLRGDVLRRIEDLQRVREVHVVAIRHRRDAARSCDEDR